MPQLNSAEDFMQDLRHGFRLLLKNRGFAIVAVITLALGIGATTAIFSVVNKVLLKSLPFPDADRLVVLDEYRLQHGSRTVSWMDFLDWKRQNPAFEDLAAYRVTRLGLNGVENPTLLRVAEVSSSFFKLLAIQPALGRTFTDQEDKAGAQRLAVISYALWRGRFGADPDIVNRAIDLDGIPISVIGVLPPTFNFFDEQVDVYMPVGLHGAEAEWNRRGVHPDLLVLARLKPEISLDSARSRMKGLMQRLEAEYPQSNAGLTATLTTLYEQRFGRIRPVLLILFSAVGCVLLISSVNVANLLLARGSSRRKEMAVRTALGAGRNRLVRQLMTESILLSMLGGILGLLFAYVGLALVLKIAPRELPQLAGTHIDGTVLLFTSFISLLTGVLFGLAPATQGFRFDLNTALNENSRAAGHGHGTKRLRSLLLSAEIAAALVLVSAAALATRSLAKVLTTDLGFDATHVLALDLTLPSTKYLDQQQRAALFLQSVQRLRSLAGVSAAGAVACPPLLGVCLDNAFMLAGHPITSVVDLPTAASNIVVPGYFETLHIPLVEGRLFAESDDRQSRLVVIVNQSFARRWWPTESAVGKLIREGGPQGNQPYREIVGVVGDTNQNGVDGEQRPEVFFPSTQFPFAPWNSLDAMTFVVRAKGDPRTIAESAKREVQMFDKALPLTSVEPMSEYVADSSARREFATALLATFAALALLLAAVGTYGVMAYNVSERVHEIGTRMALGATTADIRKLILEETLTLAIAGIVVGFVGSFIGAKWLSSFLFGVKAHDPMIFGAVASILIVTAVLASYVPMKRATKIAPAQAIRCE